MGRGFTARFALVALLFAGIVPVVACGQETGRFAKNASGKPPQRTLSLGDSLAYRNMGI